MAASPGRRARVREEPEGPVPICVNEVKGTKDWPIEEDKPYLLPCVAWHTRTSVDFCTPQSSAAPAGADDYAVPRYDTSITYPPIPDSNTEAGRCRALLARACQGAYCAQQMVHRASECKLFQHLHGYSRGRHPSVAVSDCIGTPYRVIVKKRGEATGLADRYIHMPIFARRFMHRVQYDAAP